MALDLAVMGLGGPRSALLFDLLIIGEDNDLVTAGPGPRAAAPDQGFAHQTLNHRFCLRAYDSPG